MGRIMKFFEYNGMYTQEWPMNKQSVGLGDDDVTNNLEYAKKENKFQEVQEHMKIILKPIILKKNKNAEDSDIEKVAESFFRLGNNKSQEIKHMVDSCKDTQQCAKDIVNKYIKYVKINFNAKDNINDIEQDYIMNNESLKFDKLKHLLDIMCKVMIQRMTKNQETSAIQDFEKMIKPLPNYIIKDEYFINKIRNLIVTSKKFNCYNVENFLTNYLDNIVEDDDKINN